MNGSRSQAIMLDVTNTNHALLLIRRSAPKL